MVKKNVKIVFHSDNPVNTCKVSVFFFCKSFFKKLGYILGHFTLILQFFVWQPLLPLIDSFLKNNL